MVPDPKNCQGENSQFSPCSKWSYTLLSCEEFGKAWLCTNITWNIFYSAKQCPFVKNSNPRTWSNGCMSSKHESEGKAAKIPQTYLICAFWLLEPNEHSPKNKAEMAWNIKYLQRKMARGGVKLFTMPGSAGSAESRGVHEAPERSAAWRKEERPE